MNPEAKMAQHSPGHRRLWPVAAALALGLVLPLSTQAAEAMRVVRDPVTGELRAPTAAEAAAMQKAEARQRAKSRNTAAPKAVTEIVHPDGSVEMPLDEDSQMFSVVRSNEDGTLSMACLPAKQAQAWVKHNGPGKAASSKGAAKASAAKGHEGHNHD